MLNEESGYRRRESTISQHGKTETKAMKKSERTTQTNNEKS